MSMQAIVIDHFGGPEAVVYKTVPTPTAVAGEALIEVEAFGLNHAEIDMRRGEWDGQNLITSLECVGIVEDCPNAEFEVVTQVAAAMGGMGETDLEATKSL